MEGNELKDQHVLTNSNVFCWLGLPASLHGIVIYNLQLLPAVDSESLHCFLGRLLSRSRDDAWPFRPMEGPPCVEQGQRFDDPEPPRHRRVRPSGFAALPMAFPTTSNTPILVSCATATRQNIIGILHPCAVEAINKSAAILDLVGRTVRAWLVRHTHHLIFDRWRRLGRQVRPRPRGMLTTARLILMGNSGSCKPIGRQ